VVPIHLLC